MEIQHPQKHNRFGYWVKTSITARMLTVGLLILILLIPLSYINSLIAERAGRQHDVVAEIKEKWGHDVLVYGPILKLPYKTYTDTKIFNQDTKSYFTETTTHINYAYVFPETLNANCLIDCKTLNRGNFESAVFTTQMDFKGSYDTIQLDYKDIKKDDIIWDKVSIIIKTSNLKGIKENVDFKINNSNYIFENNFSDQSSYLDALESNYIKPDDLPIRSLKSFHFSIRFNGSKKIRMIPIGKTTTMAMNSNWPDPSFTGIFLPDNETKEITKDGFSANWKVLHINRAFSQQYINDLPNLIQFAFGTEFMVMVDEYQKSERSAKYGFLVIGLTFLIFFLIQTISKIGIHPFQYLMIGIALTMFYTLLVSISEHSSFFKAYLIAGTSVIGLITLYSKSILNTWQFALLIGTSLTTLYIFIYVIIQLENYALLVGSIGLFLILSTVMFVSRKIDWNNE
ncbi:MAG: cell envelope integrity protein CreD [Flavobacteriaceae bacterium]|nr:cell envelope integrity protein CreD [Flavobacteriaceae bacterium]